MRVESILPVQVNLLVQEVRELRLKIQTMSKTIRTAELDSRASRYGKCRKCVR